MANDNHEVLITGIGFVSSLGEGADHTWDILSDKTPSAVTDSERFSPYTVHPIPEIDWAKQVTRRDARQMENWQRLGTYAAGMALEDAGIKENEELISSMDLVVAAGGGERDCAVDDQVMAESETRNDHDLLINERLAVELRPTLFLAQLSNLLAGNISIVHKVTGSSRTYMGEENAGVTAIENAASRIRSGSSTHALVGGSFHADRYDAILPHELGNTICLNGYDPILTRQANNSGMNLASGGVFLVLEERKHAEERGAKVYAKLGNIASDLGSRDEAEATARLASLAQSIGATQTQELGILSGASGVGEATKLETEFLSSNMGDKPVRYFHSVIGQLLEASFPAGIALAALALKNDKFYPKFEDGEADAGSVPSSILVTSIGHRLGEGMALVEKA